MVLEHQTCLLSSKHERIIYAQHEPDGRARQVIWGYSQSRRQSQRMHEGLRLSSKTHWHAQDRM